MQAQYQLVTLIGRKLLIATAVALLAAMAIVPAARAMSLASEDELMTKGASARSNVLNVKMNWDQIQFLEDNGYFDFADEAANDSLTAVEPSASTEDSDLLSQNVSEFEAMERAPGLYTDPSDAASSTGEAPVYTRRTHDEAKFLNDNWFLGPDIFIVAEDEDVNSTSGNPALTREQIQFAEDNWNFSIGGPLAGDNTDDSGATSSSQDNTDRADTLDGLQNGTGEVDARRSHNELTYPWGGFREYDY
jgi:hypothetical protein